MVGCEKFRRARHNRRDGGIFFKRFGQKQTDPGPVPARGMNEILVQGQIACVKIPDGETAGFGAGGGQVEDRQIQVVDAIGVARDKIERFFRAGLRFRRRAEQEITVGGDAGPVQALQGGRSHCRVHAFVEGLQNLRIAGFDAQLEHDASCGLERPAEIIIGELRRYAGKAVPGNARRLCGKRGKERRRNGAVQEMDQSGVGERGLLGQFLRYPVNGPGLIGIGFGRFRTEGALAPPAAARRAAGQDEGGRKITVDRKEAIIGKTIRAFRFDA